MNPFARKVYYIAGMPFLFLIDLIVTFSWFDTTIPLLIVIIATMVLRASDRIERMERLNNWAKRTFVIVFPDIYKTGVMPNQRTLLICVPCILAILLNIPISNLVR